MLAASTWAAGRCSTGSASASAGGSSWAFSSCCAPAGRLKVTGWAAGNNVALVFLPTYSSWLKWIEPEFAALRYFALGGTDHRTHAWQGEMIDRYIRWRNAHAQPQTNFARTQSSAPGPVTRPTLHEAALVNNRVSGLTEAIQLSVPR